MPVLQLGRNLVVNYFIGHLRGDQSLAWSFFVNWAALYVVLVLLLGFFGDRLGVNVTFGIGFLVLVMVWSVVGTALSAIRALKSSGGYLMKGFAVIVLGLAVLFVAEIARELQRVPLW